MKKLALAPSKYWVVPDSLLSYLLFLLQRSDLTDYWFKENIMSKTAIGMILAKYKLKENDLIELTKPIYILKNSLKTLNPIPVINSIRILL